MNFEVVETQSQYEVETQSKNSLAYTPSHVTPFPVYPSLQAHVKEPGVLVQVALVWQLLVFSVHSSTSAKEWIEKSLS